MSPVFHGLTLAAGVILGMALAEVWLEREAVARWVRKMRASRRWAIVRAHWFCFRQGCGWRVLTRDDGAVGAIMFHRVMLCVWFHRVTAPPSYPWPRDVNDMQRMDEQGYFMRVPRHWATANRE